MSYIDSHLLEHEELIYRTRLHWILFLQPVIWLLAAPATCLLVPQIPLLAILPLLMAIALGLLTIINYLSAEFGITNKRVLKKVGFIRIYSREIMLSKIESIQAEQSLLGRLLGYGSIVVCGTGGSRDQFMGIDDPLYFRQQVQEQIEKIRTHP